MVVRGGPVSPDEASHTAAKNELKVHDPSGKRQGRAGTGAGESGTLLPTQLAGGPAREPARRGCGGVTL